MLAFGEAVKLEVEANYAKALPMFSDPVLRQGPLGDYAIYYTGLAELRLGRAADARRTFQMLQARAPVGYLTEANLEIVARSDAPWWSTAAATADYAGHPAISGPLRLAHGRPRFQLEAGAKLHARIYNAFLEGQFRHSDVVYSSHELEPLLVDLWIGATTVLPRGISISYTVRHQTEEIGRGSGARSFAWGSIGIAQSF